MYNERLQFTSELEKDMTLNFLDLKIIRDNKKFVFNWYQKPANTNKILNFHSNHLKQHKKAIIFNIVDRAV